MDNARKNIETKPESGPKPGPESKPGPDREADPRVFERYGDILDLPHHESDHHPHLSKDQRAAQFSPFAALTGYGDVIHETARENEERMEKNGGRE